MAQLRRYSWPRLRVPRMRMPALRVPALPRRSISRSHISQFSILNSHLKRRPWLWLVALGLVFVLIFIAVLERRAAPQIQALADIAAKQQAAEAIAGAVERVLAEERVTYEGLVERREENGVKSLQTNAAALNLLRAKINRAVEKEVRRRRAKLRLPLGALLGSQLFSGQGPSICVRLAMAGDALSDIRSEISGAGVNQTMHRILLDLRVTLAVILPGGARQTEVALTVCLAETLIVGQVPGAMGIVTQK